MYVYMSNNKCHRCTKSATLLSFADERALSLQTGPRALIFEDKMPRSMTHVLSTCCTSRFVQSTKGCDLRLEVAN